MFSLQSGRYLFYLTSDYEHRNSTPVVRKYETVNITTSCLYSVRPVPIICVQLTINFLLIFLVIRLIKSFK